MKKTTVEFKWYVLLTALFLCASGIITAQADTVVTFSVDMSTNVANGTFTNGVSTASVYGSFNGWGSGLVLNQDVSKLPESVYTNTVDDTSDANGATLFYKFQLNGAWENVVNGDNRCARLPSTSGSSLVLPTPFFSDAGGPLTTTVTFQVDMSEQVLLGIFTNNGAQSVTVNGNFNNWQGAGGTTTPVYVLTNDPSIRITNEPSGTVTSNVFVGTYALTNSFTANASPWSENEFKYVIQPQSGYESPSAINGANPGGGNYNRFLAAPGTTNLTLPIVSFSDAPYAPPIPVTFSVDMSAQLYYTNWNPSMGVFCQGINGDWNNDTVNTMTNDPNASNTNIYYVTYVLGPGSSEQYKFTYNGPSGTAYESPTSTGGNNRAYTVPTGVNSATVPTVFYSDLSINDLLAGTVYVTFTVDCAGATNGTSGPVFDPSQDTVYVNGQWLGWVPWNPVNLGQAGLQMTEVALSGPLSSNYTITLPIPQGSSIPVTYKYSINGVDDEAGVSQNHVRYIRYDTPGSTNATYTFPMDTFAYQYGEPNFGHLAIGQVSGGTVPVSWLGTPYVTLQMRTSLTSGSWVTLPLTAGTNGAWGGYASTNGWVSLTNWPTSGNGVFFRLISQ